MPLQVVVISCESAQVPRVAPRDSRDAGSERGVAVGFPAADATGNEGGGTNGLRRPTHCVSGLVQSSSPTIFSSLSAFRDVAIPGLSA
jgi:hypothetical protein